MTESDVETLTQWLQWYEAAGVSEAMEDEPVDRFNATSLDPMSSTLPTIPLEPTAPTRPDSTAPRDLSHRKEDASLVEALARARSMAHSCTSIDDIRSVLTKESLYPWQLSTRRLCLCDGNPQADLLVIGEAPGAEEDRQGKPFVGLSGKLLDRILATINRDRQNCLISNSIFWRPPENRSPTSDETTLCLPFVQRMIEIVAPRALLLVGKTATHNLLNLSDGITRLRGKNYTYSAKFGPIPTVVTLHPAYLLRNPAQKRLVWQDVLTLKAKLDSKD